MNNTDKSPYLVNFMAGERNDTNNKDDDKCAIRISRSSSQRRI